MPRGIPYFPLQPMAQVGEQEQKGTDKEKGEE